MHKRSNLFTTNYFKNEAKKAVVIHPLIILAVSSLIVSYFIVRDLEWEEHITVQRGLWLFGSGLLFFPSIFLILSNLQLHTHEGRKFQRAHKLKYSDVYDISNKCVSAVQAIFCCLTGLTCIQYSCPRDPMYTSHYISEAYAWFGAAYFFYDIWSMYKVWSAKMVQPEVEGIIDQIFAKTIRIIAYLSKNFIIVFHHIFIGCFGFLVITYFRGGVGDCFFGYIYLMEGSTPFVSLRGILSKIGMKNSIWYIINGLVMLVTFFIFRIAMFPYVINIFAETINVDLFTAVKRLPRNCLISIALLVIPQIYWFYLMLKGAIQVFFFNEKSKENHQKHVSNNNNIKKKNR